ncbi:MAG: 4Fe-4S cluster-binding domain-containing protein, partial [Methanomassiliicoccaceae archaeon]|nr:4Fe-4S cluster-binding domain-containing protein [Methanomassiliicoccaceae archaeon]
MAVRKLECGSAVNGTLAAGCEHCMNGSKMVLFVSGRCGTGCFYCPVSNEKKGRDVIYANEKKVRGDDDIIAEAVSMDATGTGITGGDPLTDMERTLRMIRMLKEKFGKRHHIHLYTSSVDLDRTLALEAAGLDEIRFHPPVNVWEDIGRTCLGAIISGSKMSVGIEVPAIPDLAPQLEKLVKDVIGLGVGFVNINELEFSESNWEMISARQYELKDEISSAVLGSEKLAKQIIRKFPNASIHFCSSSFKDSVQL